MCQAVHSTLEAMSGCYGQSHHREEGRAGWYWVFNTSKYCTALEEGAQCVLLVSGLVQYWLIHTYTHTGSSRDDLSPLRVMAAGSVAGVLNWTAAIAPDTLKSRLQTAPEGKYRGVRDVFVELVSLCEHATRWC